jgi:2-hydroxychromene-2-carboxylate isomerase
VEPVPVLFAGLLKAHGLQGPAETPAKWRWMVRDILRKSSDLGLDLAPPESHPFNPLLALRISSLEIEEGPRRRLIDALFRAVWAGGPGVREPDVVAGVLSGIGLDGPALVARAGTAEAKHRLRRATEEAVAEGVFGVPTMLVDGRLFWGFDDFDNLERFLGGRDPVDDGKLTDWTEVRPSATR